MLFVLKQLIYEDQGVGKGEKNNSLEIKGSEQYHQADKTTCQETENVSCGVHDPVIFSFKMFLFFLSFFGWLVGSGSVSPYI